MREDDDPAELVDIDEEEFRTAYRTTVEAMIASSDWYYIDGIYKGTLVGIDYATAQFHKVTGRRHLALGRSTYYDRFMQVRARAVGHPVYQSDYMVWVRPEDPYRSLLFYIQTAEIIDFSLEGVSPEHVRQAAQHGRLAANRRDLGSPYMTTWEINQVLYGPYHDKTTWHIPKRIDRAPYVEAFNRAGVDAAIV